MQKLAPLILLLHSDPTPDATPRDVFRFQIKKMCSNINAASYSFAIKSLLLLAVHDRHHTAGVVNCCERSATVRTCRSQSLSLRRKAATDKLVKKSSNITVSQSNLISLTNHFYDWHSGSLCRWTCNQLTSKVGGITGSRLRWSILT